MRPIDLRRLRAAAKQGRQLLASLPNDDGVKRWTFETEQLLRDLFGQTQLWANFAQGYRGTVIGEPGESPQSAHQKFVRSRVRYLVEAVEAALVTAGRRAKDGPVPRDPLLEAKRLATDIPLTGVADYIDRAVEAYGIGHWEEAANHVAKAFERAAYALADLVTGSKAPRDLKGALKLLADNGVIAEETMNALTVRDVSLWGWTCMKGRHAEGAGTGKPADTMVEARYALDWVGSALTFLGESYLAWLERNRAKTS